MPLSDSIELREVGLRDGLQLVKQFPSTAQKQRWIVAAHAAGVRYFEVGSFLPAKTFPQFADVSELLATVAGLEGARSTVLALNERGLNDAFASQADEVALVVSATEEHSQRNARRSRVDAVELVRRARALRDGTATDKRLVAAISMAFGCSIAGQVDPAEVVRLTGECFDAGADMVSLADTVGYAGPSQIVALVRAVQPVAAGRPLGIHLHDTRGLGLANASAALDEGVCAVDAATAGLGGCPFAPAASGNIVFEDLVFLCQTKGIATGIDIPALTAARAILAEAMPDEPLTGALARAGLPLGHVQA